MFRLPVDTALGSNECSYDKVLVSRWDLDHNSENVIDKEDIAFFSTGKLGSLRHGLLHVGSDRPVLSRKEISQIAEQSVDQKLEKKRNT